MAGIVTSLNRPGGNVTGVGLLGPELETKRLELLHQLVPGTTPIGVLSTRRIRLPISSYASCKKRQA
jgi:putative ABC transport system substrate-binding protein